VSAKPSSVVQATALASTATPSFDAAEDPVVAATNRRGFGRVLFRVSILTMVAQGFGFASSVVMAHVLGAKTSTDAYYLGLSAPMLVYGVFLAGARQGGIPTLTSETASGRISFARASGELLSATLAASIVIALIATAIAVGVMGLTVGNPSLLAAARLDAIELAPLGVFGAMIGALASVLAVRNRFAAAALVLGLDPMLRVVLLVTIGTGLGVHALVIGNLAGNALAVLVLWGLAMREGVPLKLPSPMHSQFVRRVLAVSAPLVISAALLQLNPVVDRTMASNLGAGNVTSLELGLRLFAVPGMLIGSTLIGPLLATWSARKAAGGWHALRDSLNRCVEAFALILPPVLAVGIMLRHQIVAALYHGGAYSAHATDVTATVFVMMLVGLPAQLLIIAFAAVFTVEGQTMFCLKMGMLNVVFNVVLNYALRPVLGVGGIALSTSMTMTILLAVYVGGARRRWPGIAIPFAGPSGVRSALALGLMALVTYALQSTMRGVNGRLSMLAEIAVISLVLLPVYGAVLLTVDGRRSVVFTWLPHNRIRRLVTPRSHRVERA